MRSTFIGSTFLIVLPMLLAATSCTGVVGDFGGGGDGNGPGGPVDPVDPGGDPSVTGVGITPMRRLTRAEYNNTVRDLLNDTTRPADGFAPDVLGLGGFRVGGGVSQTEATQYMEASETVSARAMDNSASLLPCTPGTMTQTQLTCASEFIEVVGAKAFRRPLTADEIAAFVALYEWGRTDGADFDDAVGFVLQAFLQSPNFLYRKELGIAAGPDAGERRALTGYELASRLSYFFWQTMPDELLFEAARTGALDTPDGILTQARRLLADPKAADTIAEFQSDWLKLSFGGIEKSSSQFPTFTPELRASMLTETRTFMQKVILDEEGTFATLLTADFSFLDERLAAHYGVSVPSGGGVHRVALKTDQRRAGVLTQGAVMAKAAGPSATSPVKRGFFVREQILCTTPPPPDPDLVLVPPGPSTSTTIRQQVEQHASNPDCAGCHKLMDPIGLTFESFNSIGWHQTVESPSNQSVDTSGELIQTDVDGPLADARDLALKLASSNQARQCFAEQMFRFATGRAAAFDQSSLDAVFAEFAQNNFKIKDLMVAIAASEGFRYRTVSAGEVTP